MLHHHLRHFALLIPLCRWFRSLARLETWLILNNFFPCHCRRLEALSTLLPIWMPCAGCHSGVAKAITHPPKLGHADSRVPSWRSSRPWSLPDWWTWPPLSLHTCWTPAHYVQICKVFLQRLWTTSCTISVNSTVALRRSRFQPNVRALLSPFGWLGQLAYVFLRSY